MFALTINNELQLKLLLEKDAEVFFNSIQKNRAYLENYMPRISENQSISDTKIVINIFMNQLIQNNGFRVGIYYNDQFAGIIGLKYIDWINKKTEIMYWIDKDYTGKGIATNCVKKLIDISFGYYNLNKIILVTADSNIASQKVAKKCGFKIEGTLREDELLNTGFVNTLQFSILKTDIKQKSL